MVNCSKLLHRHLGWPNRIRIRKRALRKGARSRVENEIGGRHVPRDMVDWSNLPLDIIERIIGRLGWLNRILTRARMRAVCKAWSVLAPPIPNPTIDNFPWALTRTVFYFPLKDLNGDQTGDRYYLNYPPLDKELSGGFRREEIPVFSDARAYASSYGWVLFFGRRRLLSEPVTKPHGLGNFFLYSPFTTEVIKLPDSNHEHELVDVATFNLDATSPKCVIFGLRKTWKKIFIYICSPGDIAWKTYEFEFDRPYSTAEHAIYADGIFYCVFSRGELGAFNLQLKERTMLTLKGLPGFDFQCARLIASDGELRLMGREKLEDIHDDYRTITFKNSKDLNLLKFDFSSKRWVREISLNNSVLFIGCTCFSCPAVGKTSQLANHVFSCSEFHPKVRCYGNKSEGRQYQNWARMTSYLNNIWIEFPSSAIWSANDLTTAP
ncbi:F-box protein [Corchorus olitorius]|uniref:F-box protein n=1 Tax=Corchorus olitorius TaxID=93759 RepID=A0A1R3JPR1_9ROSI|nr:F-box protein [Corchorus olitorius]